MGSKKHGLSRVPPSAKPPSELSVSVSVATSSFGAPNHSSGVVVPLPSDKMVPSRSTVPGKSRAILTLDAFGLGFTQG